VKPVIPIGAKMIEAFTVLVLIYSAVRLVVLVKKFVKGK
ncbi:hypothetical protein LCGC14_2697320, partial [marine sediment metagenome]